MSLIPGSGRFPGGRHGNPLQCFGWERGRESCLLYFVSSTQVKKGYWKVIDILTSWTVLRISPLPFFCQILTSASLIHSRQFQCICSYIAVGQTIVYILPESEFIVSDLMWQEIENCIGRLLLNLITHQIQPQSINCSIKQHKFCISHNEKSCNSCFFSVNNFTPFIYYAESEPLKLY